MLMATMDTASHPICLRCQACLLRGNRSPLVNWQCLTFPSRAVFPTSRQAGVPARQPRLRVPSMARECCSLKLGSFGRFRKGPQRPRPSRMRCKIRHSNSRCQHTAEMETMYKHIYTHNQHPARHCQTSASDCLTCHKRGSPQRNPRIQNAAADQKAPTSQDYNQPRIAPT